MLGVISVYYDSHCRFTTSTSNHRTEEKIIFPTSPPLSLKQGLLSQVAWRKEQIIMDVYTQKSGAGGKAAAAWVGAS